MATSPAMQNHRAVTLDPLADNLRHVHTIPALVQYLHHDALANLGSELVQWHLLEHMDAIKISAASASSTGATGQFDINARPHPKPSPAGDVINTGAMQTQPNAIKISAASASRTGATGQFGINPCWFGTDYALRKVAEKSRELAGITPLASGGPVGKVFINATSGFANVRQPIWQHTIGGYQVLHKWLDDRRKAGRSLSQDDITHWLRVYAALQATQTLMLQVDQAIVANGGWPGTAGASSSSAFSQNHPPPDAATLAAEQMAQKDQLKAQKKAATASNKIAASASPTGATSLFDFDDNLDGLAAAAGNDVKK